MRCLTRQCAVQLVWRPFKNRAMIENFAAALILSLQCCNKCMALCSLTCFLQLPAMPRCTISTYHYKEKNSHNFLDQKTSSACVHIIVKLWKQRVLNDSDGQWQIIYPTSSKVCPMLSSSCMAFTIAWATSATWKNKQKSCLNQRIPYSAVNSNEMLYLHRQEL